MRKICLSVQLRCLLLILCIPVFLTGCLNAKQQRYYADQDNYVQATGVVDYIAYDEDASVLYIGLTDLTPTFDDNTFKIVGKNLSIVRQNQIDEKLHLGDRIVFMTAGRYFGDGYVMPIVGITVHGEELLRFEDGYANLLQWLAD